MPTMSRKKFPRGKDGCADVEKVREKFLEYLTKHDQWYNVCIVATMTSFPFDYCHLPTELWPLREDCISNVPRDKGILYDDEKPWQDRWKTFKPVRDAFPDRLDGRPYAADPVWHALAILRMMQLNLAGSDPWYEDWKNVWVKSLMYDKARLFKLVFGSKHGTKDWETRVNEQQKFSERCAACFFYDGREKWQGESLTVVPCSEKHTIHTDDIERWFEHSKSCPECDEVVL